MSLFHLPVRVYSITSIQTKQVNYTSYLFRSLKFCCVQNQHVLNRKCWLKKFYNRVLHRYHLCSDVGQLFYLWMVQDEGATWLCCSMQPTGNIPHIRFLFLCSIIRVQSNLFAREIWELHNWLARITGKCASPFLMLSLIVFLFWLFINTR